MSNHQFKNIIKQAATIIRNEESHVDKYIEIISVLMFFKLYDDVEEDLPEDLQKIIPDEYLWSNLKKEAPRGDFTLLPDVAKRIQKFFSDKLYTVKNSHNTGIFEGFSFKLKHDEVVGKAMNQIDKISFSDMDSDAKGDLYEYLLNWMGDAGVSGEYYTPRPVVNMIVDIIKPQFGQSVLDPATGTGGFLTQAFVQMKKQLNAQLDKGEISKKEYSQKLHTLRYDSLFGIEKEEAPARMARMNMILKGDGHSTILHDNSLDPTTYRRLVIKDHDQFDIIMSNPPYGGDQAITQIPVWYETKKPEAIFLQLMMDKLAPGGMAGIVLPEGSLFRRGAEKKIRHKLINEFDVQAIVTLFQGTFEFNDAKAIVIFFRKPLKGEDFEGTKSIWMAKVRKIDDIKWVVQNYKRKTELVGRSGIVAIEKILELGKNLYLNFARQKLGIDYKSNFDLVPLGELIQERKGKITPSEYPEKTFTILGVTNSEGVIINEDKKGYEINPKYKVVEKGDFVYNPYRINVGSIGRVREVHAGNIISAAYPVFYVDENKLIPEYLLYLLKTQWGLQQIIEHTEGTVRQTLKFELLSKIKIPLPSLSEQKKIVQDIVEQRKIIRIAEKEISKLIDNLDSKLIEGY